MHEACVYVCTGIYIWHCINCCVFSRCGFSNRAFLCSASYVFAHLRTSHVDFQATAEQYSRSVWRGERFVVLCDSVQGAIVETISQLFSLACDRLAGLMWEPRTHLPPPIPPFPSLPFPLSLPLLLPATNTPSPQRLRLATESAGGKGVCTAVASEQERKPNSWRRIKSSENGLEQTRLHFKKKKQMEKKNDCTETKVRRRWWGSLNGNQHHLLN